VAAVGLLANLEQETSGFPRRWVFVWMLTIFFLNQLIGAARSIPLLSLTDIFLAFCAIGVFQCLAWYTILRLVLYGDSKAVCSWPIISALVGVGAVIFVPTRGSLWVAAAGLGIYMLVSCGRDFHTRAAGVVLLALSVQEFFGRIFFQLISFPLIEAETAIVGTALAMMLPGTVWYENVITVPSGHGIVLYPYCSSFHNVSLGLLCWISVTSLHRVCRRSSDYLWGLLIVGTVIVLNTARLYFMALGANSYEYWHDGTGSEIFEIGASLSVLLLALYGSRSAADWK
jgi:hypothetical protein